MNDKQRRSGPGQIAITIAILFRAPMLQNTLRDRPKGHDV
jgi:hypothetical protein